MSEGDHFDAPRSNAGAEPREVPKWRRVLTYLIGGFVVLVLAIELLARWNVRREQKQRAYLGDRLFAQVVGTRGDSIVFIAGLQASTRYWNHGFDELAKDHRVIYVDLVGFGRSPWPNIEYTLDDHLAYLRRTLVALGATQNVTIVAHSFGTIIAANYAARFPAEVKRVLLLGTPVYDSEAEARERISRMSPLAAAFSLRPILAREACLSMGAARPLLERVMPRLQPELPPAVASDAVLHTWPSFRGAMNNILLERPVAQPFLTIGSKATLVHGTRDTVTPLERIRTLARATGALVIVVDSDHRSYVSSARKQIIDAIRESRMRARPTATIALLKQLAA